MQNTDPVAVSVTQQSLRPLAYAFAQLYAFCQVFQKRIAAEKLLDPFLAGSREDVIADSPVAPAVPMTNLDALNVVALSEGFIAFVESYGQNVTSVSADLELPTATFVPDAAAALQSIVTQIAADAQAGA